MRNVDLAHQIWTAAISDFTQTYREVAEAGVKSVVLAARRGEFNLLDREQALAAGRILKELGLTVRGCHAIETPPCDMNVADPHEHAAMVQSHATLMRNVGELGCQTYVVHLGGLPKDGDRARSWNQVHKAVDQLAAQAQDLGMVLALENGMAGYLASNDELVALVAGYGHPAVGLCYDSGHAHIMGDAAATLRQMSPYVVTVHLHDNDRSCDQHLIPGLGTIEWAPVVEALAACPRLKHAETEAANYPEWPHGLPVWSREDLWARYGEVLNTEGTGVRYA
ncbi:MAG: sugar phosphate isomerase/epimerase family protein [Armatimonadota bacterium]